MIVVFSGYNQRSVVAFLRTLEKNDLNYQIIASGENDTIFLTDYGKKVVYIRKKKELDLDEIKTALSLIKKEDNNIIAPSTEALNRFLLDNRISIEEEGFTIPLVDKALYEEISDKERFVKLCAKKGIKSPTEIEIGDTFVCPFVAKPKTYFSSDSKVYSPIFVRNQEEQDLFFSIHKKSDFIYQQFIDGGRRIYLLFYFDNEGGYKVASQENYIQQPGGKSMMLAQSTDDYNNHALVSSYASIFLDKSFRGLVMIEVIENEGEYYMIEANPRFWGPSQLFCDMGYNFFELFLEDYGFLERVQLDRKSVFYYWSNGIPCEEIENSDLVFHNSGKIVFKDNKAKIVKSEIYSRNDTKNINKAEHLRWLYSQTSKHSNYQVLPDVLKSIIGTDLSIQSRYEKERLKFIEEKIEVHGKRLLDIGGNTGFFTIQSIVDGAIHVDYYEGNKTHAEFVKGASELLGFEDRIGVYPEYYEFGNDDKKYDVILNLNVLHHMGDDFDAGKEKEKVKNNIISCINDMAKNTDIMIFQLGFNWKGNRNDCLFEKGEKTEMIDYIKNGVNGNWEILSIGIAEKDGDGNVKYVEANEKNLKRDDSLGEFLNRPLFIMKSVRRKDG